MSLIIHRCTICQHPDLFHDSRGDTCSWTHCPAGKHEPTWGEPEVLSTWDTRTGMPVESVVEPGTTFRGFGQVPADLCGCDECVSLYRSLTVSVGSSDG